MSDPKLLVNSTPQEGTLLELPKGEERHARLVLRLQPGTRVVLLDGKGHVASAVLERGPHKGFAARVERVDTVPKPPSSTLLLCVPKKVAIMDQVIRQATELGLAKLLLVVSERTQLGMKAISGRVGRWIRISRQALKQCGRAWELEIEGPAELEEAISGMEAGWLATQGGVSMAKALRSFCAPVALVGPEGGLTQREEAMLLEKGWYPVSMGPYQLRVETAATVAAALAVSAAGRKCGSPTKVKA